VEIQASLTPTTVSVSPVWQDVSEANLEVRAFVNDVFLNDVKVTVFTDRGSVSADGDVWSDKAAAITGDDGRASFAFSAARRHEGTPTPGVATLTFVGVASDRDPKFATLLVTVIGPPASITVAASPVRLVSGEMATVTVTVKDAIGQNAPDGSEVRLSTNVGGKVVPELSRTWGGVATAFLLTSDAHVGPYSVIAGAEDPSRRTPEISASVTITTQRAPVRQSMTEAIVQSFRRERPNLAGYARPGAPLTILFSDIEGSTPIAERVGDQRWVSALMGYFDLMREQISRFGGLEIKSLGDGLMLVFNSPEAAIRYALSLPEALSAYRPLEPDEIRHRVGIHLGDPIQRPDDIYGIDVDIAQRIMSEARSGQILVSARAKEAAQRFGDLAFGPGEEKSLKGLSGTYAVYPVQSS